MELQELSKSIYSFAQTNNLVHRRETGLHVYLACCSSLEVPPESETRVEVVSLYLEHGHYRIVPVGCVPAGMRTARVMAAVDQVFVLVPSKCRIAIEMD